MSRRTPLRCVRLIIKILLPITLFLFAAAAQATLIDDFGGDSFQSPDSRSVTDGNPIGGELDYTNIAFTFFGKTGGIATIGKRPGLTGAATLIYDGIDDSPNQAFGLGGLDITNGG